MTTPSKPSGAVPSQPKARHPPSHSAAGAERYFARLKYFKSGGGWFFLVGMIVPSPLR